MGEPAAVRLTRRLLAYPPGTRISWRNREDSWLGNAALQGAAKLYGKTPAELPYNRKQPLPFLPFAWMFHEARAAD